jgi:hypothetical protein
VQTLGSIGASERCESPDPARRLVKARAAAPKVTPAQEPVCVRIV